jgi:hypothetical protein
MGISLHGSTVQAVEDAFRCKLWNCNAVDSSGSVPPPFQTIQEIGTFQFSSHRRLRQKCQLQMADIQDRVVCSLEMYFRFFKLCLVCIPVAGVVTGEITSTATNATASTNTNGNSNIIISNNTAATTTTISSNFCINQ